MEMTPSSLMTTAPLISPVFAYGNDPIIFDDNGAVNLVWRSLDATDEDGFDSGSAESAGKTRWRAAFLLNLRRHRESVFRRVRGGGGGGLRNDFETRFREKSFKRSHFCHRFSSSLSLSLSFGERIWHYRERLLDSDSA